MRHRLCRRPFYKDLNNVYLSLIWNRTDIALRKVNRVIFCGYSLPDADIHIKYLLKRAQTNRRTRLEFAVINHHPQKQISEIEVESNRYKRFLGSSVDSTAKSFEEFVADPLAVLRRRIIRSPLTVARENRPECVPKDCDHQEISKHPYSTSSISRNRI